VRRVRLAAAVALVAVALLAAGGCGVPEDEQASPIPEDALPFDLSPANPDAEPATSGPFTEVVYYVDGELERLVPVERSVASRSSTEDRLAALLGGVTEDEVDAGLASFLADGTALVSPAEIVEGQVVVLDFNAAFTEGQANDDHRKAVAQVVWTITDIEGIRSVLFERNGEIQTEVNGDGEQTPGPLDRGDFSDLRPQAPPGTTTTTVTVAPGGD
jgi:spore germination protein GerM